MKKVKLLFTIALMFVILVKVNAANVSTLEELREAIGSNSDVVLTDDITINASDAAVIISNDSVVTIDLNNHVMTANSNGSRKIINNGNLTVKNGTLKNEGESAYGIIDSYGKLTLNSVTFIDYGCGNGSTVKIRPNSSGVSVSSCKFYNEGVETGNAGLYVDGEAEIKNSTFESKSNRVYALLINSGNANVENVIVDGTHGGIGINSGNVVIESGSFSAKNFYGIWITNDYNNTNVTINGGTFIGKYGLYSSVDDGNQDEGDVTVTINGGEFIGTIKSAIAFNKKNSENVWAIDVTGGTFSSDITQYVDTEKSVVYTIGEDLSKKYVVVTDATVEVNEEKLIGEDSKDIIEKTLINILASSIKDEALVGVSDDLGEKIKESLALNKTINSKVIVKQSDDNYSSLSAVKLPKNSKVAGYYDIELAVYADDEKIGTINELGESIKIKLPLPNDLPKLEKGYIRKFIITRIHNGEEEQLDNDIDGENIVFESDKYSTFILSYVDTAVDIDNPATLDKSVSYIIIGLISLGVIGLLIRKVKKQYN